MKNLALKHTLRKFCICANIKKARKSLMRRTLLNMRTDITNGIHPKPEELENLCAVYELLEELEAHQIQ